jgi:tetratricopeptide (TPR) repeat protein
MMKLPCFPIGALCRSCLLTISLPLLLASAARSAAHPAEQCAAGKDFGRLQPAGPKQANDYAALGAMFEERKDFSCAADAFAHAAALDPSSASLAYQLGSALYAARRMTEAERALSRSVALDPARPEARLALGVVDHDMGHSSEALHQWEAALRIDPASITTLDWIAKARIEAGQFTTAAELLRTAPSDEELTLDLMVADSKAGLFDEAIDRGEGAIKTHQDWRRVCVALSTVFVQRNRLEDAAAVLRKAITIDPGDPILTVPYLRVLVLKGDSAEAQALAAELLKQHPGDYDVLYLSGLLERERGNYDIALQDLKAAGALHPGVYDVEYNLGLVLGKLQHWDEAQAHLQKAIAVDTSAPEAHFQLAAVFRQKGDREAAQHELATYRQLMKDREMRDEGITLTTRASEKLQEGDVAAAISLYRDAAANLPGDAQAYYRLAMALDRVEAWQDEKAALEKAVDLQHGFAAAQNQLGYVAARAGDTAQAETYFRQAVVSAPQFAEAESNLGSLLASENRNAEAEQHFQAALAADPSFTDAWINLAATLASTARFDEARKAVATALQIEPSNVDAAKLMQSLPRSQ